MVTKKGAGGMARIVLIDAESTASRVEETLHGLGHDVQHVQGLPQAREVMSRGEVDVVVVEGDLLYVDGQGVGLRGLVRSGIPVAVIDRSPTIQRAAESCRHGAVDYLTPPFTSSSFADAVRRSEERRRVVTLESRAQAAQTEQMQSLEKRLADSEQQMRALIHHLRNALSAITANLSFLESIGLQGDERDAVFETSASARVMRRMLADARDLIVWADQSPIMRRQPEPVAELFGEVGRRCRADLEAGDVTLRAQPQPDDLQIVLDRALLGRVVENLIVDAVVVARPGSAVILSARSIDDGSVIELFHDRSTHDGVEYDRLFDGSKAAAVAGYRSQGMTFCRRVLEAHGGKSWAEPAGDMSRIVLWFPEPSERFKALMLQRARDLGEASDKMPSARGARAPGAGGSQ